jgi:hypothetical protein
MAALSRTPRRSPHTRVRGRRSSTIARATRSRSRRSSGSPFDVPFSAIPLLSRYSLPPSPEYRFIGCGLAHCLGLYSDSGVRDRLQTLCPLPSLPHRYSIEWVDRGASSALPTGAAQHALNCKPRTVTEARTRTTDRASCDPPQPGCLNDR